MRLSPAQIKTLRTVVMNGGEMNGFRAQRGYDCRTQKALVRNGLLELIGTCACFVGEPCDIEHHDLPRQPNGNACYDRVRITAAGRRAAGAE